MSGSVGSVGSATTPTLRGFPLSRSRSSVRDHLAVLATLDEPELQLVAKEPIVPDLAGWRVERMPELPDTAYFTLVPDWICEVLSPSTERLDRDEKLPYYAEHGVRHVWLLDPIDKRLDVFTLDPNTKRWREVRSHHGDVVRAAPFDAIELDLAALWSPPRLG